LGSHIKEPEKSGSLIHPRIKIRHFDYIAYHQ